MKIKATPWDQGPLGMDTFEIRQLSVKSIQSALRAPGHYTVKVDPLADKTILHDYGFYFCDTLLQTICTRGEFSRNSNEHVSAEKGGYFEESMALIPGGFVHDRFHRDFNLTTQQADARYSQWFKQLWNEGHSMAYIYDDQFAGFFAHDEGHIALTMVGEEFRDKGLGKHFMSAACSIVFGDGYEEVAGSVSACNVKMLNIFASLGFKFTEPLDLYHKVVL